MDVSLIDGRVRKSDAIFARLTCEPNHINRDFMGFRCTEGGNQTSLVLSVPFAGLPALTTAPLQRVQNATARLVQRPDRRSHITSPVHELLHCTHTRKLG